MAGFNIDFLESYDDDSLIAELKRLASVLGQDTLTKAGINRGGCMISSGVAGHMPLI
jgi:hypothetical protein